MIVRIMGEGQYDVPDGSVEALNGLDSRVEVAVEAADQGEFAAAFAELLAAVREQGATLPPDALVESDLVLPPADATVAEVAALLGDEGLIPG